MRPPYGGGGAVGFKGGLTMNIEGRWNQDPLLKIIIWYLNKARAALNIVIFISTQT